MKINSFLGLFFCFSILISASCKKDNITEDPHNHSLRKKSIDQIRYEISGKWKIHYDSSNGFAGLVKTIHANDIVYFLINDTIKRKINNSIVLYEKASINKRYSYNIYNDSIYAFDFYSGQYSWVMDRIKNDTLIVDDGSGYQSVGGQTFFMTRIQ